MALTVSTPHQICNSPLNTSKSKMMFSFPKAHKFGGEIKPVCPLAYYDLPPLKTTRATGFGYGTKYDFTKTSINNPAPSAYTVTKGSNPEKKKGYSFGLSREAMQVTGGQYVGDKTSPGPGAYDTREINKVRIAFTFKSRTAAGEQLSTQRHVPGPGAYPSYSTVSPNGKIANSKFKNTQSTLIAPPRSARFANTKDGQYPGPGFYDLQPLISESFVSKFKSTFARTFGHNSRTTTTLSTSRYVPGPGSYRLPSDFGYYESLKSQTARETGDSKGDEKGKGKGEDKNSPTRGRSQAAKESKEKEEELK